MNKVVTGNRLRLRAVCFGLALMLVACLSAAGAMAASGCGMKCCCLSKPTSWDQAPREQMTSSVGCCSGSPQMPCDLVADTGVKLPEISLAASTGQLPTSVGPANLFSDGWIDRHGFRGHVVDQRTQENFRAPPIYLQHLSFLS